MRALPLLLSAALLAACRGDAKNTTDTAPTTDQDTGPTVVDADGDGYGDAAAGGDDCDDTDAAVNPGAEETPYNGVDDDCNPGSPDDDLDGDGFTSVETGGADCDDADPAVNPGATESCNGVDDDCNGEVDDSAGDTWYADADGDGYGDPAVSAQSCEGPSGYVADATDCDDTTAAAHPGAEEVCDEIDNDCDGDVDEGVTTTWYADADADGHGDAGTTAVACEAPSGYVADDADCDDADPAVNPEAAEVCNGIDDDCDGAVDDDDADLDTATASTWYADADGDGYGDAGTTAVACEAPSGHVADGTDCDDADSAVNPGAAETWYDGVDADCDGASDYDADGDGDDAIDYGGTDCDDGDPSRYGGVDCRPATTAVHPDAATLAGSAPTGAADIVFADTGEAVISTVISGQDYVYVIDELGNQTVFTGVSNYNINAVTLDPDTGSIVAGYSSTQGIGYESGSSLPVVALSGGSYVTYGDGPWTNAYMDDSPVSIAMDTSGCVWTPNWGAKGVLACVELDGTVTTWTLGSDSLQTLALDSAEDLYVAVDDTIYLFDPSGSGSLTSFYVASATILDFTFDYNDDLYIETTDDALTWVKSDLSTESVLATVSGDAKLAISPDGWLVRLVGNPTGAASWEEFELD